MKFFSVVTALALVATVSCDESTCFNCEDNDPCYPLDVPGKFYYAGCNETDYVQCSVNKQCFDMKCPSGTMWDDSVLSCVAKTNEAEDASNGSPWGNLVGMDGQEAKQKILEKEPNLQVYVIPDGSPVTADYRFDRVRIFVDSSNKVVSQPQKG